jgi:hypothetical protein
MGSVLVKSPAPVKKPLPSSLLRLYPCEIKLPPVTVRDGKLQQEGSGGGGLAIYREELPRLRTFLYLVLVISSVVSWLLLLRQQRLSNSAEDVKARPVTADTNASQKISPTRRTFGTG